MDETIISKRKTKELEENHASLSSRFTREFSPGLNRDLHDEKAALTGLSYGTPQKYVLGEMCVCLSRYENSKFRCPVVSGD
jgi:hypothetical protein